MTTDLFAERLRAAREASRRAPAYTLPRRPDGPLVPSFGQESIWLADRLLDDAPDYNVSEVVRVRGPLDADVLRLAFGIVMERHEILRTCYTESDGRPRPVLRELDQVPVDVRTAGSAAQARDLARALIAERFDLSTEVPLRAHLIRVTQERGVKERGVKERGVKERGVKERGVKERGVKEGGVSDDVRVTDERGAEERGVGADWLVVLVVHHIAVDGWSMSLLWTELSVTYEALVDGAMPALPDLAVQYADYAHWQREQAATDADLTYWRRQLAGLEPLELPTDRARPPVFSGRGDRLDFPIPDELSDRLQRLAVQHGITLFHALLAGFQAVLQRWSGSDDLAVGTLLVSRQYPELESLIGFFGTMAVVRADLSDDPRFADLLGTVRDTAVDAYQHQGVPFERLVSELQPVRDPSRNPLFQVVFTLQDEETAPLRLTGCTVEPVPLTNGTAKFDLELLVTRRDGRLSGTIEYASDLFDAATMSRLAGHYLRLLDAAAADPDRRLSELDLLTPAEHEQLTGWNDTATPYPDRPVHALIAGRPDDVAVRCGRSTLTYDALDRRSNQLARLLRARGVGPESTVGVCLDRTVDLVVALVAVLKAGGGYVPVDPGHPPDRIRYVLADSNARLLLTTPGLMDGWGGDGAAQPVYLDEASDQPDTALPCRVAAENLAYLMYTSGSTGRPKGVLVPHRAVVNLSRAFIGLVGLTDRDTVAAVATHAFDISVPELLSPLLVGATVVVVPRDVVTDGPALGALLDAERVTVLQTTPAVWRLLLDGGWSGGDLRAGTTGEAVSPALAAEVRAKVTRLWDLYGPTETTVWSTAHEVDSVLPARPVPIGRPLANTTAYLLDRRLRPVPVGVIGELHLGGAGLSRGYAGKPATTAERYVPDPFGSGGRLYRTGDLCRLLPDGTIEYLGRSDSQVKVRGNRIELGEVETVLSGHPQVARAAVSTWGDGTDRQLVGYVVYRDRPLDPAELRGYLRTMLPDAMVPTTIVELAELPLNPNGKVDRARLPGPALERSRYTAPRTGLERRIVDIWAEVLGTEASGPVDGGDASGPGGAGRIGAGRIGAGRIGAGRIGSRIGVDDDFFQLGGHSLRALQVATRLRDALGVDVSLRTLLVHPTPATLAAALAPEAAGPEPGLGTGFGGRAGGGGAVLERRPGDAPAPLSYLQRRLWFLDQLQPGRVDYLVPSVVRLRGPLSTATLAEALRLVLDRHEVLRARFGLRDGVAVQLPGPPGPVEVTEATEVEALQLAIEDAQRPFDLSADAPARARVIRVGASQSDAADRQPGAADRRPGAADKHDEHDEHLLVLVAHHAAIDGWSLRLLWRELGEAYTALAAGTGSPAGAIPGDGATPAALRYGDVAYWQQRAGDAAFAPQLDYWRTRLDGLPPCELPTDRPRPASWSGHGDRVTVTFPDGLGEQVRALARRCGATVFMTLLAGLQVVLARYTGQEDVVVGTPVAGRPRAELEPLIGCFVNTLVLRGDTAGDPTFTELLGRVRDSVSADVANQDVPFERLVTELRPDRDLSRNPLFSVMLRHDEDDTAELRLSGITVEPVDLGTASAKVDVSVSIMDGPDGLTGELEYATDLFDRATAQALAESYAQTMLSLVTAPDRPLSTTATITAPVTPAVTPDLPSLPELVARQAARTPDAVAIGFGAHTMTYRELHDRASRLAGWLRGEGVGVEDVVAVALPRSPELVTALLGVLYAGGTYLALDPTAPAGRNARLIADSGARLVLDQRPLPGADTPAEPVEVRPDNRAAVYYTSGSTGSPKGVETTHRGIANFLDYLTGTAGLTSEDVVLQLAAVSFDASIRDIFGPLVAGGRVVLVPDEATRDPYALLAAIEAHQVTALLSLVPSMLTALATAAGAAAEPAPSLRLGLVSGEPLTDQHVRAARKLSRSIRLVNQYGPTECTMTSTYHEAGDEAGAIPIGRPIPYARGHVLGARGEPLPPGALGDLHLGTPGLARGYLGAPGLTAERFVPDPFGPPGGRLFRTGDLVRQRTDGVLTFHGRRDQQVKIRGVRVEPGEVEAALLACPGVRAAAVAAHGEGSHRELTGYLVGLADLADVRRQLAEVLPDQLVPARLEVLAALPLTPHGKVDRARLPAPSTSTRTGTALAARDLRELRMVGIWERVLGRRPVGVRDDFFAIGGHSLRAVELVEAVRAELGVPIPLHVLFTRPTVERLCEVLDTAAVAAGDLLVPMADGPATVPPLFLVHPQGGDVCCYAHLAREFEGTRTVYGVEAVGYNTGEPSLRTIEEMAERYLVELRRAVPTGPYLLAGWSFGGNVAFELALQLEAAGAEVGFLGVIDARAFGHEELDPAFQQRSELERYGLIAELAPDDLAALRGADEQEALAILLRDARHKDRVPGHADSETLRRMVAVFTANGEAADRYTAARRIDTAIHLFTATERHPTLTNPPVNPASWQSRTTGPVRVVPVPGNHHDLVYPPHAAALAGELHRAIDAAARGSA